MSRKVERKKFGLSFKTWSKMVVACLRLCKHSLQNLAKFSGNFQSVAQVLNEYGAQISFGGIAFSLGDFKADRQHTLSRGARQLLQQEPTSRTDKDVNTLMVALRHIPAFAEYPKKMQWGLCRVGRLETYGPRRVVLSEGDIPTSFYFILSGTVLVTAFEEATQSSRVLVQLTKGMSFGELAVISNTRRQGTVSSRTHIELLSISGEEFKDIFMAGGRNIMNSEKQRDFIRGVPFLRHWPVERLSEDPRSCTVYYFDRGQVLVRDSNNSDWIYIVLKGSLSVMKKLKRVDPHVRPQVSTRSYREYPRRAKSKRLQRRRVLLDRFGTLNFKSGYDSEASLDDETSSNDLPERSTPELFKTAWEMEFKLEQTLPGYKNDKDRLESLNYDNIVDNFRSRLVCKEPVQSGRSSVRNKLSAHNIDVDQRLNADGTNGETSPLTSSPASPNVSEFLPDISKNNGVSGRHRDQAQQEHGSRSRSISCRRHKQSEEAGKPSKKSYSKRSRTHGDQNVTQNDRSRNHVRRTAKGVYFALRNRRADRREQHTSSREPQQSKQFVGDTQSSQQLNPQLDGSQESLDSKGPAKLTVAERLSALQIQYQRRVMDREGRKTIAEELDARGRRDLKLTEVDLDPTVIRVQVLERGQYFGILPLLFPDQSSLSVISNGAECLVISKKLFLQWATEECLRSLRNSETPYPSEGELNRKLQVVVNWQANRTEVYNTLVDQVVKRKARRKQFLPAVAGQYCFRSGPV